MRFRWPFLCGGVLLILVSVVACNAQTSGKGGEPSAATELELVEKLLIARRDYQRILEQLRAHYMTAGDFERKDWAEDELKQYHRINHQAFILDLVVPPPTLQGNTNIVEANKMLERVAKWKDKGYGVEYIDNQRRSELVLQQLLTQYPQSNKISETAYLLGDLYESSAFKQYRHSARYFERCFQWNPATTKDARIRAARLYDKKLNDRTRAMELYKEVTTHEHDGKQISEANKRLGELSGAK